MARDFRPKGTGKGAKKENKSKSLENEHPNDRSLQSPSPGLEGNSQSDSEDDQTLLKQIEEMGGNESDLELIKSSKLRGDDVDDGGDVDDGDDVCCVALMDIKY